ncbi:MAG: hypothetical protein ACE5GH_05430, partial [Fidelibacterota bacterium]
MAVCSVVGHWVLGQVSPPEGLHDNTPRVYVLKGATIVPEPGTVIPSGEVVIRDGLIESVGRVARVPRDAFEVDLTGRTIYAGFIESYLVRKDKSGIKKEQGPDEREKTITGHWNPRVRAHESVLESFEPDQKELKILRELGFTAAQLVPASGIFRGRSATIHLGTWSAKSVIEEEGPAQIMAFEFGGWGDTGYPNSLLGSIALMRQTFIDARWYSDAWNTYQRFPHDNERPEVDRSLEALSRHLDGGGALCFEVD